MAYFPTYFKSIPLDLPDDLPPDHPLYGGKGVIVLKDYLPYSYFRIVEILLYDYGIDLEFIHPGYKGNRYPGYVNKYRLIDHYTREVVFPCATLHMLRRFLAHEGHILHSPNYGTVAFLRAVEEVVEERKRLEAEEDNF